MNKKALPIGIENFEKIIKEDYYYIDKTLLIKDLIDKKSEVNLITRPRRFGKSLNISMLQYFFENIKKDKSHIFDELKIMSAGERYTSEMNQYPVIKLTLKSAGQSRYASALKKLKVELIHEFDRHRYLLQSDKIEEEKRILYNNILRREADDDDYSGCLKFLSECLERHYSRKVIILIDEYDVPLEMAYFNNFYDEMVNFIRSLFESALKTNDSLYFAVLTGCLRISKESIFTGLNNLNIISITSSAYGEYFGFSEEEVGDALTYYQLVNKAEEIKDWYNGYIFGDVNVYNPWSVIKYLFDVLYGKQKFPVPHWANTSSNNIIQELIYAAGNETKNEVERLIKGETITKPIHEDIVYKEITGSMDNLWNFLFFTGYLKKVSEKQEGLKIYYELKIPNREVLYIYERKIKEWFENRIKTSDLSRIYTAIINADAQAFQDELSELLADTISYFDSHENFYHGFLLGILAAMNGYIVKSNRESGDGRNDIYIMPVSLRKCVVILELKTAESFTDLERKCDKALKQIDTNKFERRSLSNIELMSAEADKGCKYDYDLMQLGYSDVLKYGVAFYRKDCMVKI